MELDVQIGRLDVAPDGGYAHIKHLCEGRARSPKELEAKFDVDKKLGVVR